MENIRIWTDLYRENRDPVLDYPPSSDPEEKRWEENMLKVASKLGPADSILGTPAEKKIRDAVGYAKAREISRLKEIYTLFHEVEEYLKESLV